MEIINAQVVKGGGTYTPQGNASDKRLLIVCPTIGGPYSWTRSIQEVRFGGTPLTLGYQSVMSHADAGGQGTFGLFYLKEANIPTDPATLDIDVFYDGGTFLNDSNVVALVFELKYVDQVAAITALNSHEKYNGITGQKTHSFAYGNNADKSAILVAGAQGSTYEARTLATTLGTVLHTDTAYQQYDGSQPAGTAWSYVVEGVDTLVNADTTTISVDSATMGSEPNITELIAGVALVFDSVPPPGTVTLNQATLVPGTTISGSYANFQTVPTSPLVLLDSAGNTMNVTVTITDNGDGTGTFTGSMPTLPSAGNTADRLLFGTITAQLG